MPKLIIIGSGPAGYAAATYAARAQLEPLILAGEKSGGQLMLTTTVENYPGFPEGVMGPELMAKMRAQAERFGAKITDKDVSRVDFKNQPFKVYTGETEYQADAVIVTTGAEALTLGIPGETDYTGKGVSYCAVCDAPFFKGKGVIVVGGGDAALEDVLALTTFAKEIMVVHRRDKFKASKIMQQRVLLDHQDKVKVWWNSLVTEVIGDGTKVTGVKIKNTVTGEMKTVKLDGLFVAAGHKPATSFLHGQVEFDQKGYVATGLGLSQPGLKLAHQRLTPEGLVEFPTMTSVPGVFAAGDNVDFRFRQAATAAGYGVMAALDAQWWLERQS